MPSTDDELWSVPCELLVPAALGGVITPEVAERLPARIVVEAANGPTTTDGRAGARRRAASSVVPDILANAGGVTASYFEWAQAKQGYAWDDELVAERLRERMDRAFDAVWARAEALRRAAAAGGLRRRRSNGSSAAIEARGLFP